MLVQKTIFHLSIGQLITRTIDLVGMFMAMYLSELLVENIILGGAIYLLGQVWVIYVRLFNKKSIHLLPNSVRSKGLLIFVIAGLLSAALIIFYPYLQSRSSGIMLMLLIAGFILQQILTDTVAKRSFVSAKKRLVSLALLHAAFLAGYAALSYLSHLMLGLTLPDEIGALYIVVAMLSAFLLICQLNDKPVREETERQSAQSPDADAMLGVHSYRVYNNMMTNTFFAINMSITAFICYMRFLPYTGFLSSMISLVIWMVFIALISFACFSLLTKRYLLKYDRPAIYLTGMLFWVAAAIGATNDFWDGSLFLQILNAAFMGVSIACMLSIILEQGYEMKTVVELGVGKIDQGAYARNTDVMMDWSLLMSYLLLLVMLTIASFIMDGKFDLLEAQLGMQQALRIIMLILPMFFVQVGMIYLLLQPLDKNYVKKLKKYASQKIRGESNPPLENRLKKILVANYPKKIALLILKPLLRPFVPCKVHGKQNVSLSDGPVVFVCNHLELYGPIIAVLYSPFHFRPWIIHNMLDKQAIAGHMHAGVRRVFGFLPTRAQNGLINLVTPLILWIMHSTDPIPVFKGTLRSVVQTIGLSVEAMEYDDNILLFPETDYPTEGVGDFSTGFVQIAKSFYRQTGRCTTFCPIYINKKARRMTYGKGIAFNPENNIAKEKERIVDYLRDTMNQMAGNKA